MPSSGRDRGAGGGQPAPSGARSPSTKVEFLGWERPAIASAVERLGAMSPRADEADLSRVVVVTPNARTGRLLLGALIEHAEARQIPLSPPRLITPGELAPFLLRDALPRDRRPSGPMGRRLAWTTSLCDMPADARLAIAPGVAKAEGDRPDPRAWGGVAAMLLRASDVLAGALHDFRSASRVLARRADFPDVERFEACDRVARDASLRLARAGLYDEGREISAALQSDPGDHAFGGDPAVSDSAICLLGVTELPLIARRALERCGDVVAMVFAPQELREGFDGLGLVKPAYWVEQDPDLPDGSLRVCKTPEDACDTVLELLAELPSGTTTEDVVIAAPDAELGHMLVSRATLTGAVELRPAGGRRVGDTPVRALLVQLAECARHDTLGELGALARHPDVGRAMRTASLVTAIDELAAEAMPANLDAVREISVRESLAMGLARLEDLVEPLRGPPRPAGAWADELRRLVASVYAGRRASPRIPAEARTLGALGAVAEALEELGSLPLEVTPTLGGADAALVLAEAVADRSLPEEPMPEAVEVLGWLEVLLDPAPHAIVLGLHEGSVPGPGAPDPLLPESARRALGIATREDRFARDAYLLRALTESRRLMGGSLSVIANARSVGGDPCIPSRLLMRGDDDRAASRLVTLVDRLAHPHRPLRITTRRPHGAFDAFPRAVACEPLERPIEAMRVTWFGTYLRSPYEFYVSHVLGLRDARIEADELSPLDFGNLVHDVLRGLAHEDCAACTDAERVQDFLLGALDRSARTRFGASPAPAVRLQLEAARARLTAIARAHADRARRGWRVIASEWSPPEGEDSRPALLVDSEPMPLIGKIDRIEMHESGRRLAVFDYKTSTQPLTPERAHRSAGNWRDLQLPLYRELMRGSWASFDDSAASGIDLDDPDAIELGYAALPRDVSKAGFSVADWSADDLREALECAETIVRRVRRREFFVAGDRPPDSGAIAALLRVGPVARAEEAL